MLEKLSEIKTRKKTQPYVDPTASMKPPAPRLVMSRERMGEVAGSAFALIEGTSTGRSLHAFEHHHRGFIRADYAL